MWRRKSYDRPMSDFADPAADAGRDRCNYPGCTRTRLPDPATGRPTRYCGQADAGGGPIHNRATAWKARRTHQGGVLTQNDENPAAPLSMARATLDQRLAEMPRRLEDFQSYLGAVVADIRDAGDIEAAGAEVQDAHREALTKINEAERRSTAAERTARAATERAEQAERDREEADLLAEDAVAEVSRVRDETQAELATQRADADAAALAAEQNLAQTTADYQARLAERDAELERARQDAGAARLEVAAALAAQRAAEESAERERSTVAQLRGELDTARRNFDETRQQLQATVESARADAQQARAETATVRVELATTQAEAQAAMRAAEVDRTAVVTVTRDLERQRDESRAERDALRETHAAQLAQAQRNADERVHALTEALAVATTAADTYRAQLPQPRTRRAGADPS